MCVPLYMYVCVVTTSAEPHSFCTYRHGSRGRSVVFYRYESCKPYTYRSTQQPSRNLPHLLQSVRLLRTYWCSSRKKTETKASDSDKTAVGTGTLQLDTTLFCVLLTPYISKLAFKPTRCMDKAATYQPPLPLVPICSHPAKPIIPSLHVRVMRPQHTKKYISTNLLPYCQLAMFHNSILYGKSHRSERWHRGGCIPNRRNSTMRTAV